MNTAFIPTPQDEDLRLESSITKTADFDGASKDMGLGYAPGGIGQQVAAVVSISALDTASTDETYKFVVEESSDNSTFTPAGPIITVTATGVVSIPAWLSKRYVRLKLDVGGTTPSVTYQAWLNPLVA
jgi:hypothetical protein